MKVCKDEAKNPLDCGLSIIAVKENKQPFKAWTKYQTEVSPISAWHAHYNSNGMVGIITGRVSRNLEIIDIDLKNDPNKTIADDFRSLIPDELFQKLVVQTTPSGGYHYIYRCPDVTIDGNLKLAKHEDGNVILETRGEAGYFCTSLTKYTVIQGQFDLKNLDVTITPITAEEREFLLDAARSLNRYYPMPQNESKGGSNPAINEFNKTFDGVGLLCKHGWSVVKEDEQKLYLLRPGQSTAPHSAYYFKENQVFYCFSSSTVFTPQKPYNHFQLLQVMEGKDDYRTTLRLIEQLGYRSSENGTSNNRITTEMIAQFLTDNGVRYDEFIQDLTMEGELLTERDNNTLYIDVQKQFNNNLPRNRFEDTIKSHYIQPVHPVKDFVDKHKDLKPHGTLRQWLDCLTLKNPNIKMDMVEHFFTKWYVGMIAQALDGEFPNEFFLCLLSVTQGIGKTTMLRKYTLPIELQKYRAEHALSFNEDFQVIMSQTLLIIDDEMDGRTYDEDKTFKTVLSSKELTLRRKYDRRISTIKRRCSFAGSGNHLAVVREKQNRRVIPIEVSAIDQKKLSELNLTEMFMEAYNLYKSGYKYSFQMDDIPKLKQLYDFYVLKTDLDEMMDAKLFLPTHDEDRHLISNLEIVEKLSSIYPSTLSRRINAPAVGKQMTERGFKAVRRGANKITHYCISKKSPLLIPFTTDGIDID